MQDFDYQRKLAEQRRQRYGAQADFQSPQGQMVSGHFVAPNPLQYLAAGLRSIGGMRGEDLANQEIADIGKREKEMVMGETKALAQALRGTPQETAPFQAPTFDEQDAAMMGQQGMQNVTKAAVPGSYDSFLTRALESPLPQFQQMGMQQLAALPEREARAAEKQAERDFRIQQLQDQHAMRLEMMREQKASREQIAEENRKHQENMVRLAASLRAPTQAPQAQIIQTDSGPMQLINGQAMPIIGPNGKPVSAPSKGAQGLSPTAQKELFEADDAVQNGLGAISSLQKAMELNDKAYSGVGASTRATIMSNLPGSSESADATIAMENIIKEQALTSMKSIFGGNPTEGERAILLDLQASASKTPKQRAEILKRAEKAAQRRLDFNKQKADALRTGTYMQQGGAPDLSPSGGDQSVTVGGQTYTKPANMTDVQWNAYKQSVGAR